MEKINAVGERGWKLHLLQQDENKAAVQMKIQ